MTLIRNPAQVSAGERTAGTETALRSYSPADVASMAGTHGGGGGGGDDSRLNTQFNTLGTTSGAPTQTHNYTLPADTIDVNNDILEIFASGDLVGGDPINAEIRVGGISLFSGVVNPPGEWALLAQVIRTGSGNGEAVVTAHGLAIGFDEVAHSAPSIDWTSSNVVEIRMSSTNPGTTARSRRFIVRKRRS